MPLEFHDLDNEVTQNAMRCGASPGVAGVVNEHPGHITAIVAAATKVIDEQGMEWCQAHPQEVCDLTLDQISLWTRIGLFIISLFVPETLLFECIGFLIPIILELLQRHYDAAEVDMPMLVAGAEFCMKVQSR